MNRKPIAVALDGPSGAGKSSVARAVARRLHIQYVDTGAIYRTVALAALRAGADVGDAAAIAALLPALALSVTYDAEGAQHMLLDGADVTGEIRTPEISALASAVAAHGAVRNFLLETQRALAREHDVIMDGRDIGTVVLPDADVKIFLTASAEARAQRRFLELRQKGIETTPEAVLRDQAQRDRQDSARETAPLRQAEDAVRLDTSALDFEGSVAAVCGVIREKTGL